ncbi:glutamate-5-semialdehyde dehydrogenase [bacterium]|nr:glutamate-5-semialdehyde dehydrogenase [bacterium]
MAEDDWKRMMASARTASQQLAALPGEVRAEAVRVAARGIQAQSAAILEANVADMDEAEQHGATPAVLDRLKLDAKRLESVISGMLQIADQPDPLAPKAKGWKRPSGLRITPVPVPLGVIGMIYEARPNVAADAAALCMLAGNAVILRGGSDSVRSSRAITQAMQKALKDDALPWQAVQMLPSQDRDLVGKMLTAVNELDVIIPRGGKSLTERVQSESRVPTLLHLDGNCHLYLHEAAKPAMAAKLVENAKLRRTGICGALESLLVDEHAAATLLPPIIKKLLAKGCELRGDPATCALDKRIKPASEDDWSTEYLAPILSIKQVDGLEQAVNHINRHGSHHTDGIVTEDAKAANYFLQHVDSAIVMHNASTQFADGGEFGFGGEIGIATGRLHARGPVGAAQLTTYKYVVQGKGTVRA